MADELPKTRYVLDREDFATLIRGGIVERHAARIYFAGDLRLDDLMADIRAELANRQRVADRLAEIAREMDLDVRRDLSVERGYAPADRPPHDGLRP